MYPSIINTFPRPSPTDRLNNPSHSALHNDVSSVLGQVQAVIGLSTSSLVGTLFYDVRSPDSDGGGHVQTANKGGTGQTNYIKGDLLVATAAATLSKFAVSSVIGYIITADPNEASGMKWTSPPSGTKIAVSNSVVSLSAGQTSVFNTLFAASITGGTLGTSNAIRFTGTLPRFAVGAGPSVMVLVNYGANTVASVMVVNNLTSVVGGVGTIQGTIMANASASAQLGTVIFNAGRNGVQTMVMYGLGQGNSSVNSGVDQDLVIRSQHSIIDAQNSVLTGIFTVEKIT